MDFKESLKRRVALLKGLPAKDTFDQIKSRIPYTEGARATIHELKERKHHVAIVSGGFAPIVEHVAKELKADYFFANHLSVDGDGNFNGEIDGDIVDGARKAVILKTLAERHNLGQSVAIGDGANDIPMLQAASYGIAFCAKEILQEKVILNFTCTAINCDLFKLGFRPHKQSTNDLDTRRPWN